MLEGAKALGDFLVQNKLDWGALLHSRAKNVDLHLERFIGEQHRTGLKGGLRVAKHAVLYMQIVRPRLRKSLQNSWQALRGWEESQPSSYRPPLPLPLLAVMLCEARIVGLSAMDPKRKNSWMMFGTLMMVGFFGLLRPGEFCGIRAEDVSLPSSFSLAGPFAVVRIRNPKNPRQMGQEQFTEIRHPDTVNWLTWAVSTKKNKSERLWTGEASGFRTMFRSICQRLNISRLRLSPASLRAGGATWMLDEKVDVARIRFLGRWANIRSLEHYLQVARAQQISISLPAEVSGKLKIKLLNHFFMLPLPQFFAVEVNPEHLIASHIVEPRAASHVVRCVRDWGTTTEAVQKSHRPRWPSSGSSLSGSWVG